MTSENIIEDILYQSHILGIFDELMSLYKKIVIENPKIGRVDAYEMAFKTLTTKKEGYENISNRRQL